MRPVASYDRASPLICDSHVDILVNNVGIAPYRPLEDVSAEELNQTIDLHVRAAFVTAQAAVRHLGPRGITANVV